ncbi:DUF3344 domain-containing protein, partial [uncultured Methanobrevibacter sp.]|uniref:DUF3344 domain-containing protein n=1 Tax=uncultured Methanobrevibacter sp. TaxID=253161 RepID=UPI0026179172
MKNNKMFFLVSLIFITLVLSLGAASADDLSTVSEGSVSGGVDVATTAPFASGSTSAELSYDVPTDVNDVQYAGLYVNVYSGSAQPTYGAQSNISITSNGETSQIASEELVSTEGSTDGTVYTINNHTTKCYSDYHMIYDITDKVQGATGQLKFNVVNSKLNDYQFDGRIKLIGLVFAYNDGDNDQFDYWVNSGQAWINTGTANSNFDVGTLNPDYSSATLVNVALSSTDGSYTFNGGSLDNEIESNSASMYNYHKWDVTSSVRDNANTLVYSREGTFKNVLSVLTVNAPEYRNHVYVSPEGEGTGASAADPTTLVNAITNLVPYTMVHILDGTYAASKNDQYQIKVNNTYFVAENPGSAVFTGNDAYRIIRVYGTNVTLDGLTLTHGKGVGGTTYVDSDSKGAKFLNCIFRDNNHTSNGGSLYTQGENLIVEKCSFINNTGTGSNGGGSIYINALNATITDCSFEDSYAYRDGGAIRCVKDNLKVINSNFTNCIASAGGAIALNAKYVNVTNCIFTNNSANSSYTTYSGGNHTGGAIYWIGTYGVIDQCTFIGNTAPLTTNTAGGGAVHWAASSANGTIMNSVFKDNSAKNGGAVYWATSVEGRILNCAFENNDANSSGGAIYWRGDKSHIADSNFTSNHANQNGGAILSDFNVANFLDVANNQFVNNSADGLNYTIHNSGYLFLENNTIDSDYAIYNNKSIISTVYLAAIVNQTDIDSNIAYASVDDAVNIDVYIMDDNGNLINGEGLTVSINETADENLTISEFTLEEGVYKAAYTVKELGMYTVTPDYSYATDILSGTIVAGESLPSASVYMASEYANVSYAGTNNVVEVHLTNDGAFNLTYVVDFYVDSVKKDSSEVYLPINYNTVLMVEDDTIRPVTEATVNGEENDVVNYTVIVSNKETGEVLAESSIFPSVLYNGNLGKDLAYPAGTIESFRNITINGDIYVDSKFDYSAGSAVGRTDIWRIEMPEGSTVVNAFVYVAYNWDKTEGTLPVWNTSFNEVNITNAVAYRDQSNLGKYGTYGYGLVVYDVSELVNTNGSNIFSLGKISGFTAVYPSTFVILYNVTESDTIKNVYMFNGADLLANTNNTAGRVPSSNGVLDVELGESLVSADLYVFAASAQEGEGNLIVNDEEFTNVWNGSANSIETYAVDMTDSIKESNNVSFVATGSTILALQQFLVLEYDAVSADVSLSSEYSGAAFAGTDNVLKVNVTNDGLVGNDYFVKLYADGLEVDVDELSLAVGESSVILLTDDTIRPVTADTVNGASTTKVNYTAVVCDKESGDILAEATLTPTLWYNGNLGKDLAYPAGTIESFNNVTVNGGVIIETLADSTYLGSKTTNRTDVWTVNVPSDAAFANAYVYVAYNWDKTNGTVPVWTTTFNGASLSPVASYRDQSNLGTYGKYGYGLVIYDVADLIKAGENSFVLNKEDGMTAVYPSTLVALYNVTESDTLTTVYMYNGADLLSNANNFDGRLVASDSLLTVENIEDIKGAELYVFAASAQTGEGNIIVNGEEFANVWNGSSNSVDAYMIDLTDSIKESNAVSFVATGSTILALEQVVVVEKSNPYAKASLSSEYSNSAFAGTNNVLKLNLTNVASDCDTLVVDFYVDGKKVNSTEIAIDYLDSKELLLVDDTIRPVTADTVNGADNAVVNYTVIVSDKATGDVLAEATITPKVLYNGNLGKDLAYPAGTIESFNNVTVNGGVIIETLADSTYLGSKTTNRTDVWTVNVPSDAAFANAYVYVAYNWDKTNGTVPVWTTTFNGASLSPVASYRDQSNLGTYGKYGYGLVIYDVADLIKAGENSFVLNKEDGMTAVYPSTLVALYNVTESDTLTTVYMYNGADLLSNANNFNGRLVASNSVLDVEDIFDIENAELYIFAASAQTGEANLIINDEEFTNVWNGSANSVDEYLVDLTDSIKESNTVSFVATGSTILALEQFVVVEKYNPHANLALSSEYSNAAFAGTNNVLKLNVSSVARDGTTFVVDFYVDGNKVNSSEINLDNGESTELLLTDDIIRPITEDTVNGANNAKVNYTVIVSDKETGSLLGEASITPNVLYNGNLGKDLAYPAGTIESFNNVTVNGGVIIETLADSTYLGSKTTNRTDVWTVNVPSDAAFANAYVYVAYNWDKTNGTVPVWTTTFNGASLSPVASYRDQSNLGTYGKYGYGLVIYDVADLIKAGENSFVLNKEDGMTAVYPSTLVALYNVTESDTLTTVYMYNGADLLSNANNFDGRLVASDSLLTVENIEDIKGAELYVFAASAQTGEGNIIVNGEEFANVWNGSSNSVDAYMIDLTDSIKESNAVSFVATGSTILALEQVVVVEKSNPYAKASLSSEYSNSAFAGTNNVLKLNLTNVASDCDTLVVDFYVDGKKVNSTEIAIDYLDSKELLLVDDTIRPVTADTVNGADNAVVNYTVIVSDKATGDVLAEATITPKVLYNGNLGKDLAYPAGTIESFNNV